jgi:hypothetical protein
MRGVVDQDINAAEFGNGRADNGATMLRILDVARHQHASSPGIFHKPLCLLRVRILVVVANQDIGTLARKCERHSSADPTVTARDDRFLSGQTATATVAAFAVIGLWFHSGAAARHRLLLLREWRLGKVRAHGRLRLQ